MTQSTPLLIYGANGYTGRLIVREAVACGLRPVLSGRDAVALDVLSREHGLESRPVGLADPRALDAALAGMRVVLHCAGPFAHTVRPMVEACLRTHVHYCDITGEIGVFEALAAMSAAATAARITLLPGVGFDVVPSDCLALHLHERLPSATRLTLAFDGGTGLSRGTATTMIENVGRGGAVRRNGRISKVPAAWKERDVDFGDRVRHCVTLPWGDVSTAFHSTGIPDIEVYAAMPRAAARSLKMARYLGWILATGPLQALLKRKIRSRPAGPSDVQRRKAEALLWGEVANAAGERVSATLRTPDGYTLTALTAIRAATRLLSGDVRHGFCTPSMAFGADFILEIRGVDRREGAAVVDVEQHN